MVRFSCAASEVTVSWLAPAIAGHVTEVWDGVTSSVLSPCSLRSLLCPSPTFYVPADLARSLRRSHERRFGGSRRRGAQLAGRLPRDWPVRSLFALSARSHHSLGLPPSAAEPLRPPRHAVGDSRGLSDSPGGSRRHDSPPSARARMVGPLLPGGSPSDPITWAIGAVGQARVHDPAAATANSRSSAAQ